MKNINIYRYNFSLLFWLFFSSINVFGQNRVATPSFSPPPGVYPEPQNITINTATTGAIIHFTTNGRDPSVSDPIYTSPIHIAVTTTLKARAYKSGMDSSAGTIGLYEIRNLRLGNVLNVPSDYPTIQSAIDSSKTHDTVLVQPGNYKENIVFKGKSIIVGSLFLTTGDTSYISNTIIDGNKNGAVVTINSGESLETILCGFTITNGLAKSGGGVWIRGSSPSLNNLLIKGNKAFGTDYDPSNSYYVEGGGGIYCSVSNPRLSDIMIIENIASGSGGGVYLYSSNPTLSNLIITKNKATRTGGIFMTWLSTPILTDVLICDNTGGGFNLRMECYPYLTNVIISGNKGGGIGIFGNGIMRMTNSIVWNNDSSNEISLYNAGIYITNSNIKGGESGIDKGSTGWIKWQDGNITADPKFLGTDSQPYQLTALSPCINAGSSDTTGLGLPDKDLAGNPRIYGGRIDMGAYEYQGEWGSYQFNKEISASLASIADTLVIPFSKTKLSMLFHSGNPVGKVFKVTGYGSSFPANVFNNKIFTKALGYYSIKSDSVFEFSADLSFSYTDSLLNEAGIPENNLEIAFWDDSSKTWEALPTIVDSDSKIASTTITHFSLWALTDKTDALISGIQEQGSMETINSFELYSNYPNPFNPKTTIHFMLPQNFHIRLTIYNILGQAVRTLINKDYSMGEHSIEWDGKDDSGAVLSSGVYIYELRSGSFIKRKKMTLLR